MSMTKQDMFKIGIAVVLLVTTAVIAIVHFQGRKGGGLGKTEAVALYNPETNEVFPLLVGSRQKSPFGGNGTNLAFYCYDCDRNFAVDMSGFSVAEIRKKVKSKPPKCPYCGRENVAQYYIDEQDRSIKIK